MKPSLPTDRVSSVKVISGLTGLRGIGAAWVVLFHLQQGKAIPVLDAGYMGVDLFFILSGFVLSHVYAKRFHRGEPGTYSNFIKARIARIYPLHLFMLGVVGLVVLTFPGFVSGYPIPHQRFGLDSFIASAFLIQNWFYWLPTCWNSPAWSLSAEWLAYISFPVFMLGTQRWRSASTALSLAILSLIVFVVAMLFKHVHNIDVEGSPGLLRMAFEFACGCLLFRAVNIGFRPLPILADVVAIAMLGIAVLVSNATFLAPFAFAMIVILAAQDQGLVAKGLTSAPIMFLGELSYSIYLVHWIVLQISNWASSKISLTYTETLVRDIGVLALIIVLSYCTYHLIEVPARAWGRRIGVRPVTAIANADAI
jgi:peptidoglycan/LPS O-acetylase OafA/YrhL